MTKLVLSAAAVTVFIGGCSPAIPDDSCSGSAIAKALNPDEQFDKFLRRTVESTMSGPLAKARLGDEWAKSFDDAVEGSVAKYGDRWEANLAASYDETLSKDEIRQTCKAINDRDEGAFSPIAARVGPVMQRKSASLLMEAGVEVLKQVSEKPVQGQ